MTVRLLITGASGFVGRNLLEYFSGRPERYTVAPLTRAEADLLDERQIERYVGAFRPDAVLHCATVGGTRKTGYDVSGADVVSANIRMFLNLQRALDPSARLICMGSGAEYDRRAYRPKMEEERFDGSVPADPYGFSKYAISKLVGRSENSAVLRIFGLYGKYEDYTFKFISNAIVKNLLGLPITINQNVRFDYLWVEDFCLLVEKFLHITPRHSHYNITPSESTDLVSLAGLVNRIGGDTGEIRVLNPGMNTEYSGSNARLLAETGPLAFTSYADGVGRLYSYYRENLSKLDLETVKRDPYLEFCRKK